MQPLWFCFCKGWQLEESFINWMLIPTPKWYLRKILRMIPANLLMMLIEYGVDVQWVNYQSKRYEPNKGKNQGREPASEFSFHKVEKWQKYFWRMIFFFKNICELFSRIAINIAKGTIGPRVERLHDYNEQQSTEFFVKNSFFISFPQKKTHLFLAAVLARLDKTCQQQDVLYWSIILRHVNRWSTPRFFWLKISCAL